MRIRFKFLLFFFRIFRQKRDKTDLLVMDKADFHHILRKYLQGAATPEERDFIDRWYRNLGRDVEIFESPAEETQLSNRYWLQIKKFIQSTKQRPASHLRWFSLGLAACALLLAVSYLNVSFGTTEAAENISAQENSLIVYEQVVNRGEDADQMTLPDGSKVTLAPKTSIQYAPGFDGRERKVYLDGKAFFEVVPDEQRPFKVVTQKVITKVLGTSFMVTAFRDDKEVTVTVKTGKVSVYTKEEEKDTEGSPKEIILTPNQEFVFDKDRNKGARSIVDEPEALVPPEELKRMRFEDTSPKLIFEAIEKVYGVDIVFDESRFSNCRITTSISDGNILNRLSIICEVVNATFKIEEDKIVIEGDGCQSNI